MTECLIDCTCRFDVFAVACTGTQRLSSRVGLPVVCLRAATDVDATIVAMNRSGHAGWTLPPDGALPFKQEAGWRDWSAVKFGRAGPIPSDLFYEEGRFGVDLPAHVTAPGLQAALQAECRRFAVGDVVATPRWLMAQSEAGRSLLISPRYTLASPNDLRDVERADDLFIIDPSLHATLLAQAIVRAGVAAVQAADGALRHA